MRQFAFTIALPHLLRFIREVVGKNNITFLAPSSHVVESTCINVSLKFWGCGKQKEIHSKPQWTYTFAL